MGLELKRQAEYYQWFHNNHPSQRGRLRRIKNELDNHPYKKPLDRMKQLSENKATGVVPGDSDFYWIDEKITFIEVKEEARQSDAQINFETLVTMYRHNYIIVRSMEEFQKIIRNLVSS